MKKYLFVVTLGLFFSGCADIMDSLTSYALESEYEDSNENKAKAGIEKPRRWDNVNYVKHNGYILDKKQQLMWENDSGVTVKKSYKNAKEGCKNLSIGKYSNWRVPTLTEIINILDYTHYANVYPSDNFENLLVSCYDKGCSNIIWSDTFTTETKFNKTKPGVYIVDMVDGRISIESDIDGSLSAKHTTRCVKDVN